MTDPDYLAAAQAIDDMREMVRALVAALKEDGFTDREARAIVAGFFAPKED
jgi:uncharacterized membrane protein YebE (DUF533 family)